MIATILLIVAGLVVLFLIVAATRPDHCSYQRSVVIDAPASSAFPYVNNLQKWQEMSPYVRFDPNAKYTFGGPVAGVGASMAWVGNRNLGQGRLTIAESRPFEQVRMRLEFERPFKCDNVVLFTLQSSGAQTTVTWAMSGKANFMSKAMSLVMNMDKMVGGQFEEGLANLKRLAEADAKKPGVIPVEV
jgi:hypothetical protein